MIAINSLTVSPFQIIAMNINFNWPAQAKRMAEPATTNIDSIAQCLYAIISNDTMLTYIKQNC